MLAATSEQAAVREQYGCCEMQHTSPMVSVCLSMSVPHFSSSPHVIVSLATVIHSTSCSSCTRYVLTKYDMVRKDADILFDIKLHHHGSQMGEENTPSNANRGEAGDSKARKSTETCRGWNSGTCARKAADCKYAHRCGTCNSTELTAPNCSANHRASGQPAVTTAAVGPGANGTT